MGQREQLYPKTRARGRPEQGGCILKFHRDGVTSGCNLKLRLGGGTKFGRNPKRAQRAMRALARTFFHFPANT